MVRDSTRRSSKYSQKNDGEAVEQRFKDQREQIQAEQVEAQAHQASIDTQVKSILAEHGGVSSIRIPQYQACVREADKKDRELEVMGRNQEINAVAVKWDARGLEAEIIDKLFDTMFDLDPELSGSTTA